MARSGPAVPGPSPSECHPKQAVHLIAPGQLNTYDVLVSDDIVFTESALQVFLAGPPKGKSAKATATSSDAATDAPATAPMTKTEASA